MLKTWLSQLVLPSPLPTPIRMDAIYQGVANQVYRVRCGSGQLQQQFILKQFCHDQMYGLDREHEVSIQEQLARQELAPRVIYFDAARGLLLQECMTEPDLKSAPMDDTCRIRTLAETLSRIHAAKVDAPVWSLKTRIENYLARLATFDADSSVQLRQRFKKYKDLIDAWSAHPVFCHNDLSLHHVFSQPPCRVIDWEYSGFGDRLFDIASTIEVNRLDTGAAASLINAYEGFTGLTLDTQAINHWQALTRIINELWFELCHQLQKQDHQHG